MVSLPRAFQESFHHINLLIIRHLKGFSTAIADPYNNNINTYLYIVNYI